MFTVIIAEKEYIDKTNEYRLFLNPFLSSGDVVFCQWDPSASRLHEMVPTLVSEVGRKKEWRAVIICDETGINKQNPFDLVTQLPGRFEEPSDGESASAEIAEGSGRYSSAYLQFLQAEHEKKLLAYEEAAKNPLTRLTTFFCNGPTVTRDEISVTPAEQVDYARYMAEIRRKQELRQEILAGEPMEIAQPKEVLCIARRTYKSSEKEFSTVWSSHTEQEYSRFYDRNMYFDRMRYLVFDILPRIQQDYSFDYVRFLFTTIILASNDIPSGCLAAERIYSLTCKNDEDALAKLLQSYDAKLKNTKEMLSQKIRELEAKKPRLFSNQEIQQLFQTTLTSPHIFDASFTADELYANTGEIGLSDGCPHSEEIFWGDEYRRCQKSLAKMLKLSRRALKQTTGSAREQEVPPIDGVTLLDEFQVEDIREFTDAQELAMLKISVVDLYDEEKFRQKMESQDKEVRSKIQTRMDRNTTLILGGGSCLLFLLSFFSLFWKNRSQTFFSLSTSLLFAGISLGVFALVTLVTLFFLRRSLVSRIKDFNEEMHGISNEVYSGMAQYTKYLGHLCNVRRGNAVLNAFLNKENPDIQKMTLYRKHILDIEDARSAAQEVFGQFMVTPTPLPSAQLSPYEHNFDIPEKYSYPLPYTEGTPRKITFIQPGISAYVPVEFVKELTARREELYE